MGLCTVCSVWMIRCAKFEQHRTERGKEFDFSFEPPSIKVPRRILARLLKVTIKARDLEAALQSGGIEKVACGSDPNKTRIVLE